MKTNHCLGCIIKIFIFCAWSMGLLLLSNLNSFAQTQEKSSQGSVTPSSMTPSVASTATEKMTQADVVLQKIAEDEKSLFGELDDLKIAAVVPPAYEAKVLDLQKRYQAFVNTYPKHLYGKILFGKFLQKIDEPELANQQFLNANDLNPNIAVVKQQLGNYLTEHGEYGLAVPYFLSAIDLEPNVAVYHYQLGELLFTYRAFFIRDKIYTAEVLDKQMLEAFGTATKLDPNNRTFAIRYAESLMDVDYPNYTQVLKHWDNLLQTSKNPLEQQLIFLRKAQVLIEMKEYKSAEALLKQPFDVRFEQSRAALLEKIQEATQTVSTPATPASVSTSTASQNPSI